MFHLKSRYVFSNSKLGHITREPSVCSSECTGLCGSGLVDATAAGITLQIIQPNGWLHRDSDPWALMDPVKVTQQDVREVQLAKSAIASGITTLLSELHASIDDVDHIYLAGGFGNAIDPASAFRIGLIPFPPHRVISEGNTALRGVKELLQSMDDSIFNRLRNKCLYISLNEHTGFAEKFAMNMRFPQ